MLARSNWPESMEGTGMFTFCLDEQLLKPQPPVRADRKAETTESGNPRKKNSATSSPFAGHHRPPPHGEHCRLGLFERPRALVGAERAHPPA